MKKSTRIQINQSDSQYNLLWRLVLGFLQFGPSILTSNYLMTLLALMSVQLAANSVQGQISVEQSTPFDINVLENNKSYVGWPTMAQTNSSIIYAWSYGNNTFYPNSVHIRCYYLDGTQMTSVIKNAN